VQSSAALRRRQFIQAIVQTQRTNRKSSYTNTVELSRKSNALQMVAGYFMSIRTKPIFSIEYLSDNKIKMNYWQGNETVFKYTELKISN